MVHNPAKCDVDSWSAGLTSRGNATKKDCYSVCLNKNEDVLKPVLKQVLKNTIHRHQVPVT